MFDIIRKFVSDFSESEEPQEFIHSRKQLAEAALMYHVIAADGVVQASEKEHMRNVLVAHFDIDEAEAKHLLEDARDADNEAIDLYKFTSLLKQTLSEEERVLIIENLWEMVFADGVINELEDNVVWRVAELLGVSSRDRMLLKKRVWKRRSGETISD